MKLGLTPLAPDSRDLRLANFAAREPDGLPATFGHGDLVHDGEWGMLANDQYGDCVWAGAAHETMVLGREGGHHPVFDDAAVLGDYAEATGFDPRDPNTDRGTDMRAAAQFRRKSGIADAHGHRHRIGAYLWLERGDVDQLWKALYTFGVVGVGYELPESAEQQFSEGKPWDVEPGSPIVGGHYVPAIGRRAGGFLDAVSWGRRIAITPRFYQRHCMAAFVFVSASVLGEDGRSPEGLDLETLKAALGQIAHG